MVAATLGAEAWILGDDFSEVSRSAKIPVAVIFRVIFLIFAL